MDLFMAGITWGNMLTYWKPGKKPGGLL